MNTTQAFTQPLRWLGQELTNLRNPETYLDPLLEAVNPLAVRGRTLARVESIQDETHDTRTFVLRPHKRWPGFRAGDHVNLTVEIDGVRHTRPFSLSSAPARWHWEGIVTLTIKRLPGGRVTNWLHDHLQAGDLVELGQPFGDFHLPDNPAPLLFIAGGSGITPILSQLEVLAERRADQPVTLIYCVRTDQDLIGARRLEQLGADWPAFDLNILATEASDPPRYLEAADLAGVEGLTERQIYLCGPPGLMQRAEELLQKQGVDEDVLHRTYFTVPQAPAPDAEGGVVRFSRSGVAAEGTDSLLELGESAGLALKHGCRMGICHECSCRKTAGTVVNRITGETSGAGEETIQLCISLPRGEVEVDA